MNKMITDQAFGNGPLWDTITTAEIAGIAQQTLLAWRRNYHLLGGPRQGAQGRNGYWHDLLDVLTVCAAADIARRGIDPEDACVFQLDLRASFERIIENKGWPSIVACHPRGRDAERVGNPFWTISPELTMGEALARSPTGTMLVIDLKPILDRVVQRLGVTL
jgi:hypothetical protein